ncbi:uncharacterized protein B0I36DRAFT_435941, partial [Microdochium trichocladiopsis]
MRCEALRADQAFIEALHHRVESSMAEVLLVTRARSRRANESQLQEHPPSLRSTVDFDSMCEIFPNNKPQGIPINQSTITHDLTLPILPPLRETDTLETIACKYEAFAASVEAGSSIAVRTGTYRPDSGDNNKVDIPALEIAETQVISEMVTLADVKKALVEAELRKLHESIQAACDVIRLRADTIRVKIPGSKANRKRVREFQPVA